MQLRVVTLNVWNEEGAAGQRAELINRELRGLDPDLVALQEVVDTAQLGALLDGTGLHATHQSEVVSVTPPHADRYGGNAIASRWPHRVVEALDLRGTDTRNMPWCTLAALVPLPDLGDVLFIAPTAAPPLGAEAVRERQVMALADLDARHRTAIPTIMAGDFNAGPDTASIRYLAGQQSLGGRSVQYHDAWAVAGDGPGHTWTADNPNAVQDIGQIVRQPQHRRRLDYIFVGGRDAHPDAHAWVRTAELAFDRPVDGVWASDHFGVVADLDVGLVPTG
jgi:endonuclease/exonuclease/phosphatase family metal-dependent hydrolase